MSRSRILVVDDEEDLLLLCRINLELEGFEVVTASNGEEALDAARAGLPPDLILLDVMMPGMDGYECLEELKRDPELKSVPVIMLTARVKEEHQARGLAIGASAYITKPFDPRALVAAIRQVLSASTPGG